MDYKAIARAITDPENQPHQWSQEDLAQFFMSAADEIERLREAIKVQANAVRSLQESETTEINRLRKTEREAHIAIETLDSERKANAILTDEIERLRESCFGYPALLDNLPHEMLMALHDHIHTIIDERNGGSISQARKDKAKKARSALQQKESE